MKKMKISREKSVAFEEWCELYLNNCKERNLREETINHHRRSYVQFFKYFDRDITPFIKQIVNNPALPNKEFTLKRS